MASAEQRNARLDRLEDAVNSWADKKKDRLKKEAKLLKRVLKGRTGAERLNDASLQAGTALQVNELNQFLTGE